MASNEAYKFYVQTRTSLGETAIQIFKDLQSVYGNDAPSRATVFRYAKTPIGSGDSGNPYSPKGRPTTVSTSENAEIIEELVIENRHLSLRDIEEITGINHELVRRILHDKLQRRYLCSTWIPHALNEQQKLLRKNGATSIKNHLIDLNERDRLYAVQDETWIFFDPVLPKAGNKAWVAVGEKRPAVVRDSAMTKRKTLLSVIFTPNKKFHLQATSPSETIDSAYFVNFLHKTGEKWRSLRSDPTRLNQILLQFDNARPHVAKTTKEFLSRRGIKTLWQPPYSPDLNLCDRWLFDKLKRELNHITFQSAEEAVATSLEVLRSIPQEQFDHQLRKLLEHCELVIDNDRDYVVE